MKTQGRIQWTPSNEIWTRDPMVTDKETGHPISALI